MDYFHGGISLTSEEYLARKSLGLPNSKSVSYERAKNEAQTRSRNIFAQWQILKGIMDRHENLIRQVWASKTTKQRADILCAVWPDMSAVHRPDFEVLRTRCTSSRQKKKKDPQLRKAFLWPYVNLEDLTAANTLPLFLNARANNSPGVFAWMDVEAAHVGLVARAIEVKILDNYTMMFKDRNTEDSYGELISWRKNPRAERWSQLGYGMEPSEGFVVLEIQESVYRFLVHCCNNILYDDAAKGISPSLSPMHPTLEPMTADVHGYDSLIALRTEAPYRAPATMDLLRLESLFAAQKSASEDHLWALREDPGYFASKLNEVRDHDLELVKDAQGNDRSHLAPGPGNPRWCSIISSVVGHAYTQLATWNELLLEVQEMRRLQEKYLGKFSKVAGFPMEYAEAIFRFRFFLNHAAKQSRDQLRMYGASSPLLRQFYHRLPEECGSNAIDFVSNGKAKPGTPEWKILSVLGVLCSEGRLLFILDIGNVVDDLERLIQSDPSIKSLISPLLGEIISHLAIHTEGLRQLKNHQPWAEISATMMQDRDRAGYLENFKSALKHSLDKWSVCTKALKPLNEESVCRFEDPSTQFYYPIEEGRTKTNVLKMRLAEENLDALWVVIDEHLRRYTGNGSRMLPAWKSMLQHRTLERTPEWTDPEPQSKPAEIVEQILKPLSEVSITRELGEKVLNNQNLPRGKTKKEKKNLPKAKVTKAKTIDAARSLNPANKTILPSRKQPDSQPIFRLGPRSLKVFRTVFHTPSVSATPGEIPWKDFLNAMVAIGFQPEKLYGSVWMFKPTMLDIKRGINFHEPHPVGKIPYRNARVIGRRLQRAYGWNGSMFGPKNTCSQEINT